MRVKECSVLVKDLVDKFSVIHYQFITIEACYFIRFFILARERTKFKFRLSSWDKLRRKKNKQKRLEMEYTRQYSKYIGKEREKRKEWKGSNLSI